MIQLLQPRKIRVTEKFLDYSNDLRMKLNWKGTNSDALLFEWYLIESGFAQKPLNWRHDFIYDGMKIDVKEIQSQYFSIQVGKKAQYKESIIMGELTHFLFYTTDRDWDIPLQENDIVEVKPISICDARDIIKAAFRSNFRNTEAFLFRENLEILGEKLYETINQDPAGMR